MSSILSNKKTKLAEAKNEARRAVVLESNKYLEKYSFVEYANLLNIYAQVAESYASFFAECWCKNDVEMTNKRMSERLGIPGWTGLSDDEHDSLGEYVLALDCPVNISRMKEFFARVMMGDLEFLCRYPIGKTNAFDLIKSNIPADFWNSVY